MKRPQLTTTLTLTAILALALQPTLMGHLPWRGDGLLHFYRLAALERAVAAGDWYPRWLPELGLGYGFPLFNYYAPFSYYVALPFRWLGLSLKASLNLSYALSLAVLVSAVYLWGRTLWGRWAGLGAAVALIFSPYILYNLHHRAALAELWGLAWLAMTLAAVARLTQQRDEANGRWDYGLLIISYTALLLSHNITALLGTPVVLLFVVVGGGQQGASHKSKILPTLAALFLALSLSAFFWLPAFAEKELVQIEQLYASTNFAYQNNFLTVGELFALPPTADPNLINPPIPLSLGLPQILLAAGYWLLAAGYWLRQRHPLRLPHAALITFLTVAAIFMTLPPSQPIWDTISLLQFVQFPWRFLGIAAIGLALLCGAAFYHLGQQIPPSILHPSYCLLLALSSLPLLFPAPPPDLPHTAAAADLTAFEVETGWLGTTAAADYLPRTVKELPPPLPPDQPRLQTAETAVSAPIKQFYFPGWQATLNGEPVELRPSTPFGLITAELPSGNHTLTLQFGSTPIRTAANVISAVALIATIALGVASSRRQVARSEESPEYARPFIVHSSSFVLLFLLLLTKTLYLDHANTPFRQTAYLPAPSANFDNQLHLLSAELPPQPVPADAAVPLTLIWQIGQPQEELSVGVHLLDADGRRYAQSDHMHPAAYPVTRWRLSEYGRDAHTLELLPASPAGTYTAELFVYTVRDGRRLNLLNADGLPIGNTYPLGQIEIAPPRTFANTADLDMRTRLDAALATNVSLLGLNAPTQASVGDFMPLTLFWQTAAPPAQPISQTLQLRDAAGVAVAEYSLGPHAPDTLWQAGQIGRHDLTLLIPPQHNNQSLPTADYTLTLGPVSLAHLHITAPQRTFSNPITNHQSTPIATLASYTVSPQPVVPPAPLHLTLIWQATATPKISYTAFAQLLTSDGRLIAQSDKIPGDNRPTTGWLPNERITDTHTFTLPPDLPAGSYQLIVGFYDSATGQRLPASHGDHIAIPELIEVQTAE